MYSLMQERNSLKITFVDEKAKAPEVACLENKDLIAWASTMSPD